MLVHGLELQQQKVVKVRKSMNAPSLPIQHWQTNGKTRGYLQQTQVLPSAPLSYWWRGDGGATGAKLKQRRKLKPCISSRCCGYCPDAEWCEVVKDKRIFTNSLNIASSRDLQMAQDNKSCQWNGASAHDSWSVWDKSVLPSWSTNGPLLQPYSADQTSHLHCPSGDAQMIFICPCVNI